LRLAAEKGHLTCTVLRVSNDYSVLLPPDRMHGLEAIALTTLHGAPIIVFGNMDEVRDYVYLQDICTVAEKVTRPKEPFASLNVGSAEGRSVTDVLNIRIASVRLCADREGPGSGMRPVARRLGCVGHNQSAPRIPVGTQGGFSGQGSGL
jgi:dTDP-D-glucose 4,6-dehydratase